MPKIALLLHNIRSTHNVGSIFRTADAAGVQHIYLSGYTPRPTDRFGRVQKEIAKTALGAERSVPWKPCVSPAKLISKLREEGWHIAGVEQDVRAVDHRTFRVTEKTLVIVGNEVRGMSPTLRDMCDILLEIPLQGTKESLNVSVATGIALFSMLPRPPSFPPHPEVE